MKRPKNKRWQVTKHTVKGTNQRSETKLEERWKREDNPPVIPDFTAQSIINADLMDDSQPLEFLDLFLDYDLYMYLTAQTNLYATQFLEAHPGLPPHSRCRHWQLVSATEMKQFLSLYLLTGITKKPLIHQYWSTHPMLKTQFFNNLMLRNHFQSILEFFHFNDNSQFNASEPNRGQLFKIRPVVEDLTSKFKSVYTPTQQVSIDEKPLVWKGRLGLKQYIPNKHAQFGIKMFSLCEVCGYLWNSFVYCGKNSVETPEDAVLEKELGKSGAVIPKLKKDLYGKGYHLYIENWYTSENLFNHLQVNGTTACGTAMSNRLKAPLL